MGYPPITSLPWTLRTMSVGMWRYRYSGIYFGSPYDAYGINLYDPDYYYTPSSEQVVAAQEQVNDYLVAVKPPQACFYSSLYFSGNAWPTKKQLDDYRKRIEGRFATTPANWIFYPLGRSFETALFDGI